MASPTQSAEEPPVLLVLHVPLEADGSNRVPLTLPARLAETPTGTRASATARLAAQFCLDHALPSHHIAPLAGYLADVLDSALPRPPVAPATPSWLVRAAAKAGPPADNDARDARDTHHPVIDARSRAMVKARKRKDPDGAFTVFDRLYARAKGAQASSGDGGSETAAAREASGSPTGPQKGPVHSSSRAESSSAVPRRRRASSSGIAVVDRLYQAAAARKAKIAKLRAARDAEKAEREASVMRAKPKITPLARDLYERKVRGRGGHSNAFERLHADREEIEKARAERAKALQVAELAQFTFAPVVNKTPLKARSASPDGKADNGPRFVKLYEDGARRSMARDELREQLEESHTYHPDIGADKFLARNESRPAFFARLSQAGAHSKQQVIHQLQLEQGLDLRDKVTGQAYFKPLINESSATIAASKGPVHERLYQTPKRRVTAPQPELVEVRPASRVKARKRTDKILACAFERLVDISGGSMETSSFIRTAELHEPAQLPFPKTVADPLLQRLYKVGEASLGLVSLLQFKTVMQTFLSAPDTYGPAAYVLSKVPYHPPPQDPATQLDFTPAINDNSRQMARHKAPLGSQNPPQTPGREEPVDRAEYIQAVRSRLGLNSPLWQFDSPVQPQAPDLVPPPSSAPLPTSPPKDHRPPWRNPLVRRGTTAWETFEERVVVLDKPLPAGETHASKRARHVPGRAAKPREEAKENV
ncbi:uncharacterized protein AMSG_04027 [Thecamonas trahens ATCC 50062]|uniref:Uncharacterized protein n=1 Tax=Thecamonas trahens ATCC 50062 TaxID=461836 RepID=A0A0L0D618_THETB|nr:hypothetical protein AMSG_04027 [Thecamonas trahens ATCC 50062]KNC47799.1 hypothetical protein AMSG_04027 [Thecamonas trahens ATCC 50062]|eukprot:XP_013759277.1 hypothetical protein AMSG_04027 [Thecamonas trahens ATCC 50062]